MAHSLAMKADGSVYTWAANSYGELGIGNKTGHWLLCLSNNEHQLLFMKIIFLPLLTFCTIVTSAQQPKTELYDLVKKFLYDSTGFENVGDWAVGQPKKYPVSWKADRIEMSKDTGINFYRVGTANITMRSKTVSTSSKESNWNVMLKGPRMGYASFSILSPASADLHSKFTLDSIFGNKPYTAKLVKSCDTKPLLGYYYYEVKLPKKDLAYIKLSWLTANGNTAIRIDGYDNWSKYAVKFDCR